MRSTKGTGRHYIVLSRVGDAGALFEVQRFEYIPGDQFKTRKSALRHAGDSRMRWQTNCWQYRDATMTLTDTAELPVDAAPVSKGKALQALLTHHVSKGPHVVGRSKSIAPIMAPTNNWPEA